MNTTCTRCGKITDVCSPEYQGTMDFRASYKDYHLCKKCSKSFEWFMLGVALVREKAAETIENRYGKETELSERAKELLTKAVKTFKSEV